MTTIGLLILAYLAFVVMVAVVVLAMLTAGKRADEAMAREPLPAGPIEILPAHAALGHVAAEVRDALAVERVTVIVADPEEPHTGVVGACLGAPGLLGLRVPVEDKAATGVLGPAEAVVLGLTGDAGADDSWTFAHVPLDCAGWRRGAVAVAARRLLAFSTGEMNAIERLARRGAPDFDRRRRARTPA
jgi:hypothetical protein